MKNITVFTLWFVVSVATYLYDIFSAKNIYKECWHNPKMHFNQFFHHFLCYFLLFGWMFDDFYILSIHAVSVFVVLSHSQNHNGCKMSRYYFHECKLDASQNFRSIYELSGVRKILTTSEYGIYWKMVVWISLAITTVKLYQRLC